jgi:hypothetical protein
VVFTTFTTIKTYSVGKKGRALFGKEVGFEVGSDSKEGFLFPTYIFLLINHYMSVSDVGIKRAVRAKLNM